MHAPRASRRVCLASFQTPQPADPFSDDRPSKLSPALQPRRAPLPLPGSHLHVGRRAMHAAHVYCGGVTRGGGEAGIFSLCGRAAMARWLHGIYLSVR